MSAGTRLQHIGLQLATLTQADAHLESLVDEAITIIREVATECENPVLLFSGGKDSAVLLHLALLAFAPARLPFPVLHVDTGHNFPEVIDYRDEFVRDAGVRLLVASVRQVSDLIVLASARLTTFTISETIATGLFSAEATNRAALMFEQQASGLV
jgi:fermentation-respiration switch protein FrsA (DUF1100 family)